MKSRYQECIQEWEPAFRVKSAFFKHRMERRRYQDVFCIPIFVILMLGLISFSAYLTHLGYQLYKSTGYKYNFLYNFNQLTSQAGLVWIALSILVLMNIFFVMAIICLLGKYPEFMIKVIVVTSVLTLSSLSVYFFITAQYALGAILMLLFVIYVLAMFCVFREHFKTCVLIVKVVGVFFKSRPNIFWISVVVSAFAGVCVSVLILSAAGLLQMIAFDTITNTFGQLYLLTQIVQYILILYFIYYITTFLVSCSVSNWYFENSSYNLCAGMGWMLFNHLGSITFAALAITPIKIINTIADSAQKNTDNMCAQVSICLLKPCLSMVEGLVKTLNRYSIITIAFTGQSFVTGAKSAAVIAFQHHKMLSILEGVESFYFLSLWLLSVIWSVAFGFFVGRILKIQDGVIFTSGVLILINALTSLIWTSIFTQTIASTFFFYLMQQKLKSYNYKIFNIDKKVKDYYKEFLVDNDGGTIQDSEDEIVYPRKSAHHKEKEKNRQQITETKDFDTHMKTNQNFNV